MRTSIAHTSSGGYCPHATDGHDPLDTLRSVASGTIVVSDDSRTIVPVDCSTRVRIPWAEKNELAGDIEGLPVVRT